MEYKQEYCYIWNITRNTGIYGIYANVESHPPCIIAVRKIHMYIYRHIVIYAVVAIVYSKLNAVYVCNKTTDPERKVQKKKRRTLFFGEKTVY